MRELDKYLLIICDLGLGDLAIDTAYVYFIQNGDEPAVMIGSTIHTLDSQLSRMQIPNNGEPKLIGAIDVRVSFGEDRADCIELGRVATRLEHVIKRQFNAEHIYDDCFNLTEELRAFITLTSNMT